MDSFAVNRSTQSGKRANSPSNGVMCMKSFVLNTLPVRHAAATEGHAAYCTCDPPPGWAGLAAAAAAAAAAWAHGSGGAAPAEG